MSENKQNKSGDFVFYQKVILVTFLMVIWVGTFYLCVCKSQVSVYQIIGAFALFALLTYIIPWMIYSRIVDGKTSDYVKKILHFIKKIAMLIASPTWATAKYFKSKLKPPIEEREMVYGRDAGVMTKNKTKFIVNNNMANILFSILIAAIVYLTPRTWMSSCIPICMLFVVFRTLSRSFEITIAFGQDAIDKKPSSLLKASERLMLAFTSLVECILNYAVTYYLVGCYSIKSICKWQAFVHSFQSALFIDTDLLVKSLKSTYPEALPMLQITQVITCMTLVIIAFAIYLSGDDGKKSIRYNLNKSSKSYSLLPRNRKSI